MVLPSVPDLMERRLEAELMDSPTLDRERHLGALDALARVNAVSRTVGRVWAEVVRVARRGRTPVRVLDVACGGGDVLRGVALRASSEGVEVELHGCDRSPVALERARERAGALGARLVELDVLRDPLPSANDIVCSSLFLHHLAEAEAAAVLASMAAATDQVLLVQDLLRTRLGYLLAWAGLGLLTSSDVARHDGLVSVASAWTVDEVASLCRVAGLRGAEIRRTWPQRFALRWTRT